MKKKQGIKRRIGTVLQLIPDICALVYIVLCNSAKLIDFPVLEVAVDIGLAAVLFITSAVRALGGNFIESPLVFTRRRKVRFYLL